MDQQETVVYKLETSLLRFRMHPWKESIWATSIHSSEWIPSDESAICSSVIPKSDCQI